MRRTSEDLFDCDGWSPVLIFIQDTQADLPYAKTMRTRMPQQSNQRNTHLDETKVGQIYIVVATHSSEEEKIERSKDPKILRRIGDG